MVKSIMVVIPTHNHPTTLKYSIESAQNQTINDLDIVIIGDGVNDDTRDVISDILKTDDRIRFEDEPKRLSRNEVARHRVVSESKSDIVTYLGDDDLLFPNHVEVMKNLLINCDFTHPLPVIVRKKNLLKIDRINLNDKVWVDWHLKPNQNKISLTGVAHTMNLYRRLEFGWRPAPKNVWSDHYMWQQIFDTPDVKLLSSDLSTTIKLPTSHRQDKNMVERESEIKLWSIMIKRPDFFDLWQTKVRKADY
jgi:glycosyltransferase involved in cell wall biosynthesis